jgi:putative transposase
MTRQVRVSAGGVLDIRCHVVWCPKYRRPVLAGRAVGRREELISAQADGHGWRIVALGILPCQMYLFVKPHLSGSPSRVPRQFKGFTSRLPALWSRSYCAATVGAVSAQTVFGSIGTRHGWAWRKERPR